jgi:hypothetical protein
MSSAVKRMTAVLYWVCVKGSRGLYKNECTLSGDRAWYTVWWIEYATGLRYSRRRQGKLWVEEESSANRCGRVKFASRNHGHGFFRLHFQDALTRQSSELAGPE